MTNELHKENSPYLLQHAENPVHWQAWNEDTLELARKLNKPILISVGYAACHWCHVMEKECFEDPVVAEVMNSNFINIKVDREERPDIDQLYMSALQIMTRSGGWPMNIVALPDGRPFWGATYLRKEQWISVLEQLGTLYRSEPEKIDEYASRLTEGIGVMNSVKIPDDRNLPKAEELEHAMQHWQQYMDQTYGGRKGAPKFMMPVNLNFLLAYTHLTDDKSATAYAKTTLQKMAFGGVWDHLGGGFARYSTDERWHVPHFEMMLYDNAQLLTTYAQAFKKFKDPEYRDILEGIYAFITRELTGPGGEFYSSLDADSLNAKGIQEEGAFYTWTETELRDTLGEDYEWFSEFYNINATGHWEEGRYVLYRTADLQKTAKALRTGQEALKSRLMEVHGKLMEVRNRRAHPPLDDKCLTSWNALTITGLVQAFLATGSQKFLDAALNNYRFLEKVMFTEENALYHSYREGKTSIPGFLEDYCFLIEACINLYQAGCGEHYILTARNLCNYTIDNFFDEASEMFRFTSKKQTDLVNKTIEKGDNVIPASNSVMAHNLFELGALFGNRAYTKMAEEMLVRMKEDMTAYAYSHANWWRLSLRFLYPSFEVAVTGANAKENTRALQRHFFPNMVVGLSQKESNIPLLRMRFKEGQDLYFVCRNHQCELPADNLEACINQLTTHTK